MSFVFKLNEADEAVLIIHGGLGCPEMALFSAVFNVFPIKIKSNRPLNC
jgi:hypothetical protein